MLKSAAVVLGFLSMAYTAYSANENHGEVKNLCQAVIYKYLPEPTIAERSRAISVSPEKSMEEVVGGRYKVSCGRYDSRLFCMVDDSKTGQQIGTGGTSGSDFYFTVILPESVSAENETSKRSLWVDCWEKQ